MQQNDISLAQWALVDEIKTGKWKTTDFSRIAREDFDLNGIEFVNTLFEVPTLTYLNTLKRNAEDYGVTMVLIMVDDEGDAAAASAEERDAFVVAHKKWIDIAQYLGCHAIRTNCRSVDGASNDDALKWAADSYSALLEYAGKESIKVLIENHGGVSNDADWMVNLMQAIDHPLFGTYPDWREPSAAFDNYDYLKKTLPYAKGMSYRNQPTEALTAQMIAACTNAGYVGWYGIESDGRDAIAQGKKLLNKYLFAK